MKKEEDLVTLMTLESSQQAYMYRSILETNGVAVYLSGEEIHNILPMGILAIELQVSSADEARARRILSSRFDRDEFREGTSEHDSK